MKDKQKNEDKLEWEAPILIVNEVSNTDGKDNLHHPEANSSYGPS